MSDLKRLVQRVARRFGYEIRRAHRVSSQAGLPYEDIVPHARYAPWRVDAEFRRAYGAVEGDTLVDQYRLFELWSLARQTAWIPGDVIEIGVWRGGSGALIARSSALAGSKSTIYLCDTFAGVAKAGGEDSKYRGGEHSDTSVSHVESVLARLGLGNASILKGIFPDETGGRISGVTLRLAHIDVDVFESARDALDWVWRRLSPGGVVVFDDYGFFECDGVTRVVEQHAVGPGRIMVYNLNGHAVVVKGS